MRKMQTFCILLIISFSLIHTSAINPENVVIAINCGGEDFKDSNGIQYEKVYYNNKG
jgi:hypothetical protein